VNKLATANTAARVAPASVTKKRKLSDMDNLLGKNLDQIFRDQKSGLKIRIGQLARVEVVDDGVIAIDEGMSDEYFVVGRVLSRNGLEQLEIDLGGFVQKREPL
jgi:hypothetical protein